MWKRMWKRIWNECLVRLFASSRFPLRKKEYSNDQDVFPMYVLYHNHAQQSMCVSCDISQKTSVDSGKSDKLLARFGM